MAISGVVDTIYRVDGGIKLDLMPYKDDPVGQRYLTILNPTRIPPVGAIVCGGGEEVVIYPDPTNDRLEWVYYHPNYTTLYENFGRVPALQMAYWYQHTQAGGEPKPQ